MKKTILFLAALAMMAAGCSQKDDLAVTNTDPNAICFNAYTSTAVTRGVVTDGTDIYGTDKPGIGVFAFYQPAVRGEKVLFNSRKYATPDFMYNQSVTSTDGSTWTYSPIKFWPNNTNDMVSFFAYAPYDKSTTWEDLGITTDACANKLTATFPIYTEKTAMQDVLWAEPVLNNLKPSTTDGAVNNPITFNFKHILSKVALYVGVETDQAKGQAGTWTDSTTNITIDKVEFTNLAASVVYTDSIDDEGNLIEMTTAKCVGSSAKQNIVLTNENNDFEDTTAVISKTNGTWATIAMFRDLLAKEGTSSDDAFLFLAPQKFDDEQVIITYTVATTASDASNSSSITNTITKDLSDVLVNAGGEFKSGSAYKLKFLIGMNSVKFDVEVGNWTDVDADTIPVPANEAMPIAVEGQNCTISNIRTDATTGNVLFEVAAENANFVVCGSKDSVTWLADTLLAAGTTPVEGKCVQSTTDASPYTFIYKPASDDTIKAIKVKALSVAVVGDGCTISDLSETDENLTFNVTSTRANFVVCGSKDGSTWLADTLLVASEADGKFTKSGTSSPYTFTYKKFENDTLQSFKVKAITLLPTTTDCKLLSVEEDDDKITYTILDNGSKTALELISTPTGITKAQSGTTAGTYTESVIGSTHTITYYKKSSDEYTDLAVAAGYPVPAVSLDDNITGTYSISNITNTISANPPASGNTISFVVTAANATLDETLLLYNGTTALDKVSTLADGQYTVTKSATTPYTFTFTYQFAGTSDPSSFTVKKVALPALVSELGSDYSISNIATDATTATPAAGNNMTFDITYNGSVSGTLSAVNPDFKLYNGADSLHVGSANGQYSFTVDGTNTNVYHVTYQFAGSGDPTTITVKPNKVAITNKATGVISTPNSAAITNGQIAFDMSYSGTAPAKPKVTLTGGDGANTTVGDANNSKFHVTISLESSTTVLTAITVAVTNSSTENYNTQTW